jgi:transcriptional regulator GlxA family with amidase domain
MRDFTVLVLDGAYASSVTVTLDILRAAVVLAPRAGVAAPQWRLVSPGPAAPANESVRLQGEVAVMTARIARMPRNDGSTWIVPGLGLGRPEDLAARLSRDDARQAAELLRRHAQRGGRVAASCSAVFLLQRAGLLAGRRATTSWWLAPLLGQEEPACTVDADRMVCADGPVVTAGAALAQTDLMLHLLRAQCGSALSDSVSRFLLIDGRQAQAPFIVPEVLASGDALVARLTARIEKALPHASSVAELARELCVSERTLARHVQRATGKSTQALIHSVRLRRAKTLLSSSRLTVEQVAAAVGYQDATALRRIMRKLAGANPGQFRASPWPSPRA